MSDRYVYDAENFDGYTIGEVLPDNTVAFSGYLYNNKGPNLSVEEYSKVKGFKQPVVVGWDELYKKRAQFQREKYLKPAERITEEQYFNALEALPPINWQHGGAFEHFRFMELLTDNITTQFAKMGDKCISKNIVVGDRSTWITLEDFNNINWDNEGGAQ